MPSNAPKPGDCLQSALEAYADSDRVRFLILIGIINGMCVADETLTRNIMGSAAVYGYGRAQS